MKMSLIEIVQDILSDMNSDNVNSLSDSLESQQVAQIVKSTYYELHGNRNWPHTRELFQLNTSGTISRPTHMKIPDNVKEISECDIKYNKQKIGDTRKKYEDVFYLYPDEFLQMINRRNTDNNDVDTILDINDVELNIITDKAPEYWTSFDDVYIVMDSYDIEAESNLQNSKTQVMGYVVPTWSMTNTFIPDMPVDGFPLLLAEAKSRAFISIKEIANEKVEQSAQKQSRWMSRKSWTAKGGVRYPDYGRKTGQTRNKLFDKGY